MATKPRYLPAKINITYTEGDTGDLVFHFTDIVDLTSKDVRVQVRDEDYGILITKDSGDSVPSITIENWYEEEEDSDFDPDDSNNTWLGYTVTVLMESDDTKGHDSLTNIWEMEMYDADEINTLVNGKFVIIKEIVEHE